MNTLNESQLQDLYQDRDDLRANLAQQVLQTQPLSRQVAHIQKVNSNLEHFQIVSTLEEGQLNKTHSKDDRTNFRNELIANNS
jgi:hypothetical protein